MIIKNDSLDESFNAGKELFNYFFKLVLTDQEKIKLKSLKIYSQYKDFAPYKVLLWIGNEREIDSISSLK